MTIENMKQEKLAVLIDADNTSSSVAQGLFEEIAKYGVASVKRIYGDWSSNTLSGWRAILLKHALTPVQQFAYTKGKDATDMGLIIDAMDLLYSGNFSGFCLVSSDSDFTPLASRIRASGLVVYGFGREKTPEHSGKPATDSSMSRTWEKWKKRNDKRVPRHQPPRYPAITGQRDRPPPRPPWPDRWMLERARCSTRPSRIRPTKPLAGPSWAK